MKKETIIKLTINHPSLDDVFKSVKFVIKAMAQKPTRYALNCVSIQKNVIVATDDRKLHLAHYDLTDKYEPGLYDVLKCTAKEIVLKKSEKDANFPDYNCIVPDVNSSLIVNLVHEQVSKDITNLVGSIAYAWNICIDSDFLHNLVVFDAIEFKAQLVDEQAPIQAPIIADMYIGSINLQALLMPFEHRFKKPTDIIIEQKEIA